MKFSPWQSVALVAVLFAAVILTYRFASPEAGVVVSMVSTLFGTFFVQRAPNAPSANGPPDLKALPGGKDGAA